MSSTPCLWEDSLWLLAVWWFSAEIATGRRREIVPTATELAQLPPAKTRGWSVHQIASGLAHAERAGFAVSEYREVPSSRPYPNKRLFWRISRDGKVLAKLLLDREGHKLSGAPKKAPKPL